MYSQDNFYIVIETYHLGDRGDQDNVHELEEKKLKKREVVPIDIANDHVAPAGDRSLTVLYCNYPRLQKGRGSDHFQVGEDRPGSAGRGVEEECGAGDDGLQAGHCPVQMVSNRVNYEKK